MCVSLSFLFLRFSFSSLSLYLLIYDGGNGGLRAISSSNPIISSNCRFSIDRKANSFFKREKGAPEFISFKHTVEDFSNKLIFWVWSENYYSHCLIWLLSIYCKSPNAFIWLQTNESYLAVHNTSLTKSKEKPNGISSQMGIDLNVPYDATCALVQLSGIFTCVLYVWIVWKKGVMLRTPSANWCCWKQQSMTNGHFIYSRFLGTFFFLSR